MFKSVNLETVKFINILNELATLSLAEAVSFSKVVRDAAKSSPSVDEKRRLVYVDSAENVEEYEDICLRYKSYPIVLNMVVDEIHDDIISTYDDMFSNEFTFRYIVREYMDTNKQETYVEVKQLGNEYDVILIENGEWTFY